MNVNGHFLPIGNALTSINERVNFIGVAVETSIPKVSKGTDCYCSVRIIDESSPTGIRVIFFLETMRDLPRIQKIGDIVVVYNVKIEALTKGINAVFNKKTSSFALFNGRVFETEEFVPYQVHRYRARGHDNEAIRWLRRAALGDQIEALHPWVPLREINNDLEFNLLCKVLHIAQFRRHEWMLFIWDGTDTPPISIEANLEDEMENSLPLTGDPYTLPRDVLCTFPCVGTVLRVIVQGDVRLEDTLLKVNSWVKFLYVRCEAHNGLWRGVLLSYSKLCYMPDDDNNVLQCQRSHDERVPSKWGRMPFTSLPWPSHITETSHPDVAFVTLMNVLTHPEAISKFKCVVRIVALYPWKVEDFRSREGVYAVNLTLEDPTARIHAILYKEEGVKFFGDRSSIDELTKKRNKLLGIDNSPTTENVTKNSPWIQCSLKSYYMDQNDSWGNRVYHIFDTTCVV